MAIAPLIRTPLIRGGTMYAFSSVSKDLTKSENNDNIKFEFRKFVCLDLPNFEKLDFNTFSNYKNTVQFDTIDGSINNGLSGDLNVDLAESIQNYALNIEALLLSDDDYDSEIKKSVAERVFFKWLKELGAIRYREATDTEESDNVDKKRYTEEDTVTTGSSRYQQVVKYVGDIDLINSVEKAGETYSEVYIHIPSTVGNTPTILFDTVSDANYKPNLILTGYDEYLEGRNSSTIHPEGLSLSAFYDYDTPVDYTDPNANWHNEPVNGGNTNSYFTELSNVTDSDSNYIFSDASSVAIKKYPADYGNPNGFNGVAYVRSKLDGVGIDFSEESYYDIVNDPTLQSIQQYNSSNKAKNFEFNAILLYYDLYDISNPNDKVTNLYGVLFLDNVTPTTNGGYIERFKKFKPDTVTGLNGTSYGLTFNYKYDTSVTNGGIDLVVNEYNNFSMGLFVDAMVKLQESSKIFNNQQLELIDIKEKLSALENRNFSVDSSLELSNKIDLLEQSINNSQAAFDSNTSLLDLIASNSDAIQDILDNNTSIKMQYNTDILQSGSGIIIDKSVPNKVILNNTVQEYSIPTLHDENNDDITSVNNYDVHISSPSIFFSLLNYTNMCRVYTYNSALNDLKFYIDDENIKFKKGQCIRFVFINSLELDPYNIKIYSDSINRLGLGEYGKLLASVNSNQLISKTPIFELVCLDELKYLFSLDIIK